MIANKLKGVLPLIISESQSAFQSDKTISDNTLVAFETLHHMKNQKSKKKEVSWPWSLTWARLMIGGVKFLEGHYVEDGLENEMGGFDNELYKLGFLLNSS